MGCVNRKPKQSSPVIIRKETIHERQSMNPHQEDVEAEVIEEAKTYKPKENHDMDVASKMTKNESKATLAEGILLSQTAPLNNLNTSIPDNSAFNYSIANSKILPPEKPSFPNYEHKFDFDMDIDLIEKDKDLHKEIDEFFNELNEI